MNSVLTRILANKRHEVQSLAPRSRADSPQSDRDFEGALRGRSRAIIAELKPRSPSAGTLTEKYDPEAAARRNEQGGAAALSVVTDRAFFGGAPDHLIAARAAVHLPVLRKDFLIDAKQVAESRRMGADACLLIVAALLRDELVALHEAIRGAGMAALVEVHDEQELEVALSVGATLIGVNHRDLRTMIISPDVTGRLLPRVPDNVVLVAESGFMSPQSVLALPDRVNGVLIGTALMRSDDPVTFLRQARGAAEISS